MGNLLLTDEGVGPTTIAYLGERWRFPEHVELVDGATAGLELMNVFGGAAHLVVVDTVLGGAEPGAIYRFHPGSGAQRRALPHLDPPDHLPRRLDHGPAPGSRRPR